MIPKSIVKNPYFWLIIAIGIFIAFASFFSFSRWNHSDYFWKVLTVSGATFTTEDKGVWTRQFIVTSQTKIGKGRLHPSMPSVGDNVLVFWRLREDGFIEAFGIRIIDNTIKRP